MRYRVAAPDLSGNELKYVADCVQSTWISSQGKYLAEFETQMAALVKAKHAVATCNGTVALHLALEALGVGPGDEVIVPSLTYIATANAVTYCGARPVFCDVHPDTWCIDAESCTRLMTPQTRGIIPVHLFGHPCDMEPLWRLANDWGIWLLEDNAEALGAKYRNRPTGSLATAATFSFFGNKTITTGEGGMVTTDDADLADRLRLLRGQGMDPNRRYWHPVIGFNFRMTNLAAALGCAQLERVGQLLDDRRQLAGWYRDRLEGVAGLTLQAIAPEVEHSWWMYSILVDEAARRDRLMRDLAAREIETRPLFYPVHQFPMYRNHRTDDGCPVSCDVSYRGVSLPTATYLTQRDADYICDAVRSALEQATPLRRAA